MNVPYFVKVLIVVFGWIVAGVGFYLGWTHSVYKYDFMLSLISSVVGSSIYILFVFSSLLILDRID